MKHKIFAVTALAAAGFIATQAIAGTYTLYNLSELQHAQLKDGTYRLVFKACSGDGSICYWWTPQNNANSADNIRNLATTAYLAGKQVSVQCGGSTVGQPCSCQNANVFENNQLATNKCVWNIDGMEVLP